MTDSPDSPNEEALAQLEFDAAAVLDKESRILLDPNFLGALHAELQLELSGDEAARALLQMGFLHGLQDALRAIASEPRGQRGEAGRVLVPPLSMRTRFCTSAAQRGLLQLQGVWPKAAEATARLASSSGTPGNACSLTAGYTSGWLSGTLDAQLLAVETQCTAAGDSHCTFEAREAVSWREAGDTAALALLEGLPFEAFSALVRQRVAPDSGGEYAAQLQRDLKPSEVLDRDAAVIHIWGPVMVIPYSGSDEALRAIELIGNDPGARAVSVVVVDFAGAIVDEAFGALSLELIVRSAEAWGAEVIFAEVPPLSEAVVRSLHHPPLFVLKDLDQAIARAFQIAGSQQRDV